ncbi:unnamed protein product [Ambrosiozyma monospora]|uniref:Unnamed protein product n=1 Tax=Ambrosiozyma monospora TaxID=43982 RepID=A0ACB5T1E7_AMBMO|nr:unnamed protein product [Ambrosiozyma monospora]
MFTSSSTAQANNNIIGGSNSQSQPSGYLAGSGASMTSSVSILESNLTHPNALIWKLTLLTSISGFMFGYDTGYVSSILVTIGQDLTPGSYLSVEQKQWITSATSVGAFIGSSLLLAGTLSDSIGRRKTLILSDILFLAGAITQFLSYSVTLMVLGRLIMGFGVGIGSLIAPLFISEFAPSKYRGKLVVVNCLCITGGQLIAYAIGALCKWRDVVLISCLPCGLQLIGLLLKGTTDTPRFLIMKGLQEEAFVALKTIYNNADDSLISDAIMELSMEYSSGEGKLSNFAKFRKGIRDIFSVGSNKRALVIGCGLQAAQQFVGFNSLMYFSTTIFKMVGYNNSTGVSCIIAGTNFLFTALALLIIDKIGRRRILLISMPLLCAAQVLCAVSFYNLNINVDQQSAQAATTDINKWGIGILAGLVMFVAFYAIGLGSVPWQQSELFPQNVRGIGTSLSTSTNWLGSMIIAACFLTLMQVLTPCGTFFLFASITLFFWVMVYLIYPEFGGLQLEEVQGLLKDKFDVKGSLELHEQRTGHTNNDGYTRI